MKPVVYLLHFKHPIAHAQHYLGWTNDLDERLRNHRKGNRRAGRLPQVFAERGIPFVLAEVWLGDRSLERQLKRRHKSPRLCPICQAQRLQRDAMRH